MLQEIVSVVKCKKYNAKRLLDKNLAPPELELLATFSAKLILVVNFPENSVAFYQENFGRKPFRVE